MRAGLPRAYYRCITPLLLLACLLLPACERKVIREKSFSSEQFKQYEHLPRVKDEEPKPDGKNVFEKMGDGISDGAKDVWKGMKGLNPFD